MSKPKPLTTKATAAAAVAETPGLLADLRQLIEQSRQAAAAAVNASLTLMYWHIGQRIGTEVLAGQRAGYGEGIVVTLSRQLSWSHFLALLPVKDPLARDFYAQMCSIERWSVRTLRERVDSMLFERTALSKKPDELIRLELDALQARGDVTAPLLLKDPYVLDFLALDDRYLEKGLEDAILRELEHFLLELGAGFSFVARQRRIQLDSDDFYIDLLFYNRKLRRLVAIELKLGEFKAEYKGQMELYLRWLARHDQEPGDLPPLGIILCTGKKHEQIELLELDKSGIHVAEYLTVLPPREVFEQKIHEAMVQARLRVAQKAADQE